MLLPFVLILKEPDLGSALVLLPTGLVMMFVAGTPKRYLLQLAGAVGLLAALFLADGFFCRRAGGRFRCSSISATGCWFILAGLHGFRSAARHSGGVAAPASTTVGR